MTAAIQMEKRPPSSIYASSGTHFRWRHEDARIHSRSDALNNWRPRADTYTKQSGIPTRAYITQNMRPIDVDGAMPPYPVK